MFDLATAPALANDLASFGVEVPAALANVLEVRAAALEAATAVPTERPAG